MALVLLLLLYLALAAALALLAGRPLARVSPAAAVLLALLPLAFTAEGFLPGRTLAPTPLVAGVSPWAEGNRAAEVDRLSGPVNPLLLDAVSQFLPWREAARRDLLFNPSQGGGAALLANGQSAVLFPTEALARLLTPFRAVTFSQAARLLLAVWGMFLLARWLGAGELAALVAAAAWSGAGFVQVWRLHPHTLVSATAPWIVLALLVLARRPDRRSAAALAVAGAMGLAAGHPETLLHIVLFGLLLVAGWLWVGRRGGSARRPSPAGAAAGGAGGGMDTGGAAGTVVAGRPTRVLGWGIVAALLSLLLAAPLLLPFVENLVVSHEWVKRRAGGTVVEEASVGVSLERLRPTLAPLALGDPLAGTWHGPENFSELSGGATGAAALLLAGLAFHRRRGLVGGRRLAAVLLAVGLLGLLVSIHLPGLSKPFGLVPLLKESLLKRLSLWWALAVPMLAALGVQAWWEARRDAVEHHRLRRLALPVAVGVALAVVLASGWPVGGWSLAGELVPLVVALVAVLLPAGSARGGAAGSGAEVGTDAVRDRGSLRGSVTALAAVLLLGAVLVPRAALFAGWVPATTSLIFYPPVPATDFVAARLAESGDQGFRVAGIVAALPPQSAAFFDFPEVRAYDPMTFAPYARFLELTGEPVAIGWNPILDPALPVLDFLGARWIFDHPHQGVREGVEVVYRGPEAVVYDNPGALPRLYVPRAVEVRPTAEEALATAAVLTDFAERVAASGDLPVPHGSRPRVPNGAARVEALRVEPGRIVADVTVESLALLATSQPAIPGWRAEIDGEPAGFVRVNGAFLGLLVDRGRHHVELRYAPQSWTVGLLLFLVGAVLTTLALWPRRRGGAPLPAAPA